MSTTPSDRRTRFQWFALVFVVALAWRALAAGQIADEYFFAFRIGDAAAYHAWAREIAGGDWLGRESFYQSPLYPYGLATVYALLGDSRLTVVACQVLAGALAATLLCAAGCRACGPAVGVVSGLLLAVYAPAIFFDLQIQKSSLDVLLVCLLLWLLSRVNDRRTAAGLVAVGGAAGLLALNRENALVLLPVLFLWRMLRRVGPTEAGDDARANWRRRGWDCAWLALGVLLPLAPVAVRNRVVGGEWLLTTAQSGPNFYIGNHAGATGSYTPLVPAHGDARFERADARRLAEQATGRELDPAAVSRYWREQALDFIGSQPAEWVRLLLRKLGLFWNHRELIDTEDLDTYSDFAAALRWPGPWLNFGVLAAAAVPGVWVGWQRHPSVRLWCGMILAYMLSVVAFYVVARYRLPVVPPLMLLAAVGLVDGRQALRNAETGERLAVFAATAVLAIACSLPLISADRQRTGTLLNFGAELLDRGDAERAAIQFHDVLGINPRFPEAHFNLARAYVDLNRLPDAATHFFRALELDPGFSEAALNLGNVALELRQYDSAVQAYQHALALRPDDYRIHFGLGVTFASQGRWEPAQAALEESLRLRPDYSPALQNLEQVRRLSGRPQ